MPKVEFEREWDDESWEEEEEDENEYQEYQDGFADAVDWLPCSGEGAYLQGYRQGMMEREMQ